MSTKTYKYCNNEGQKCFHACILIKFEHSQDKSDNLLNLSL